MRCQYSRQCPVSSEKHEAAAETGGARRNTLAVGTVTIVVDGYWTRPDSLTLSSRTANVARRLRFRTPARLYVYDAVL
jgi:hypothetical protein